MSDHKDDKEVESQLDESKLKEKETLLTFPCEFPIKIMGKAHEDLRKAVEDILAEHAPEFDNKNLVIKESKDGNYHAITAVINAESKEQLDNIYYALTSHDLVLFSI